MLADAAGLKTHLHPAIMGAGLAATTTVLYFMEERPLR
jgi:hypothetical protein